MTVRRFLSRIWGDRGALSVLAVSLACLLGALFLVRFDRSLIAGALVGAAVSSGVGYLISFLQSSDQAVPQLFIDEARRELDLIGYYRTDQRVTITLIEGEDLATIRLLFTSKVIPIRGSEVLVDYPRIELQNTSLKIFCKVGDQVLTPGNAHTLKGRPEKDILCVEYKKERQKEYFDDHIWRSPVLGYDITFNAPEGYSCEAHERIGDKSIGIDRSTSLQRGQICYSQLNAAFSRQGFGWKIEQSSKSS